MLEEFGRVARLLSKPLVFNRRFGDVRMQEHRLRNQLLQLGQAVYPIGLAGLVRLHGGDRRLQQVHGRRTPTLRVDGQKYQTTHVRVLAVKDQGEGA